VHSHTHPHKKRTMSMLNHRDRHLLQDLEPEVEHVDPAWVRQFKDLKPARRTHRDLLPQAVIGLLMLLAALGLLLDIPVAAAIFGSAAIVLTHKRYRYSASWAHPGSAVVAYSGVDIGNSFPNLA
jgi:hypothetical protein